MNLQIPTTEVFYVKKSNFQSQPVHPFCITNSLDGNSYSLTELNAAGVLRRQPQTMNASTLWVIRFQKVEDRNNLNPPRK
ncbi:hypothetical protein MTR_2g005075 [Medicago truncatula]|uniref:Uncharacterized protein n=1 Tax=Medicago truncatula TaxID=3880 RepID=A0A072VE43_MEDTR|nr:hypothetical protein MTR_2g005075 [Medicago truncatula]